MLDASYAWRGEILNLDRHPFLDRDHRLITPTMQIARAAVAPSLPALRLLEDPMGANISSERFPDHQVTYEGAKRARYPDIDAMLAGLYDSGRLGAGMRNVELAWWS